MDEVLYDEMFRLESTHWWFVAKRRIVLSLLEKYLPIPQAGPAPRVVDIGCGCGMTLCQIKELGYDAIGVDANDTALSYCAERGVQAVQGLLPDQLNLPQRSADAVLMLDVLEHLDDDAIALGNVMGLLRPGGLLILTVPAHPWLWTYRDEFHHHKRRYTLESFKQVMAKVSTASQSKPLFISHFNTCLFPLGIIDRLTSRILPPPAQAGDMRVPPLGINRLFSNIFAGERFLLRGQVSLPFGLSLLAVVQKSQASGATNT